MGYVGPRGTPLSTFLGWSQRDQEAALTWQAHEASRCTGCGRHPDDPPRHAHVEVCPDCAARIAAARTAENTPGAHVVMVEGHPGDGCPKCVAEAAANPHSTQAQRRRRRR